MKSYRTKSGSVSLKHIGNNVFILKQIGNLVLIKKEIHMIALLSSLYLFKDTHNKLVVSDFQFLKLGRKITIISKKENPKLVKNKKKKYESHIHPSIS